MKTRTILAMITALIAIPLFGMDTYYVIEIKNFDKSEEYKVMSKEEFTQLSLEIRQESKLHAKAIAASEKAWKEDPEQGKRNFPKSAVTQRSATIKKQTTNAEEAIKIATKLIDNIEDAEKRRKESEERKYKVRGSEWEPRVRAEKAMKAEQRAKDEAEQEEKDAQLESAREIFIEQLKKLTELESEKAEAPSNKAVEKPALK